jgi:hypothetical protein
VTAGLPLELKSWLLEKNSDGPVRDFPNLRITLGPNNKSWYATDGKSWKWKNLPAGLSTALSDRMKDGQWTIEPRLVCLGANDNYLMITEAHGGAWLLTGYPELDQMVDAFKESESGLSIVHVSLCGLIYRSILSIILTRAPISTHIDFETTCSSQRTAWS